MTTGTTGNEFSIGPFLAWDLGGWGKPMKAVSLRTWSGEDGFGDRTAIHEYDCEYRDYRQGSCSHYGYNKQWNGSGYFYGCVDYGEFFYVHGFPTRPANVTGLAELPALNKLISGILQHDFQMNVSLGEAPESLTYIYKRLKPLVTSIRQLKKGDIRRALRTVNIKKIKGKAVRAFKAADAPASYWLEYRYAIMPMIMDINNAMEYIDSKIGPPQSAKIRKGSKYVPLIANSRVSMGYSKYWPERRAEEFSTAGITLKEGFDYEKVDFSNPFTVAWELTPFSFVVDWSIQIGNYLRARWFFNLSQYSDGFISSMLKYDSGPFDWRFYLVDIGGTYANDFEHCGLYDNTLDNTYDRNVIIRRRRLIPGTVPIPLIRNPLTEGTSWKRVVDALTLLSQAGTPKRHRL